MPYSSLSLPSLVPPLPVPFPSSLLLSVGSTCRRDGYNLISTFFSKLLPLYPPSPLFLFQNHSLFLFHLRNLSFFTSLIILFFLLGYTLHFLAFMSFFSFSLPLQLEAQEKEREREEKFTLSDTREGKVLQVANVLLFVVSSNCFSLVFVVSCYVSILYSFRFYMFIYALFSMSSHVLHPYCYVVSLIFVLFFFSAVFGYVCCVMRCLLNYSPLRSLMLIYAPFISLLFSALPPCPIISASSDTRGLPLSLPKLKFTEELQNPQISLHSEKGEANTARSCVISDGTHRLLIKVDPDYPSENN